MRAGVGAIAPYTLNFDARQKWSAGLDAKILLGAARLLQELKISE